MIKKVIILVVADVLLFTLFVFLIEKPGPSVALGEIIYEPLLFIINLVAGLIFLACRKKQALFALLINAFLSVVFFHIVWDAWYDYYQDIHYKTLHFRASGYRYEVEFDKDNNNYSIRNNSIRNGSSSTDLDGRYTEKNGTYYLEDSGKTIVVTADKVIGFPKRLDTVKIDIDSYYW